MPEDAPEPGDKVAWNWGGGAPGGEVVEKKEEGEVAITSKRGNTIKKNAEPENPAVHVGRSGQDVVKKASELEVVEEGSKGKGKGKGKSSAPPKKKKNQEEEKSEETAANGKKREHDEATGEERKEEAKPKKATKAAKGDTPSSATNGETKKGRGRPKKTDAEPKPKKTPTPRATEGIGSRTRSRA